MRLYSALPILAAVMLCLAPRQLPAQFNYSPGAFSFSMDSGMGGSRLGVGLRDIDADRANVIKLGEARGVEVLSVEDESPAEQAGLKTGDVLLSYNGENIVGAQQLGRLVSETPRGRKVKIQYWRDGKAAIVTATTTTAHVMPFPGISPGDLRDLRDMSEWPKLGVSIPTTTMVWKTPLFGIECESLDSQLAEFFGVKRGVLIRSVSKDSPAGEAGLRAGDVVTQIGDHPVTGPKDIASYVRSERRSAKPFSLEVTREHKPVTLKVTLAKNQE
jgi:serine protease Do